MIEKIKAWGRTYTVNVEYDVYNNEHILPVQKEALDDFIRNKDQIMEESRDAVIKYIKDVFEVECETDDELAKAVIPRAVLIPRDTSPWKAAVLCDTKYDEEHGLAIKVLRSGIEVSPMDDVL